MTNSWYKIENKAGTSATVHLYDEIGAWGTPASSFVKDLAAVDAPVIDLHVNSPGGNAFDGLAIMNALRQHPAKVIATVDGIAASAASFIVIGGADEVVMARNSELMIHDASGVVIGRAADMRKTADVLDQMSSNIASIYADKAKGPVDQWRAAMVDETWYSAQEAVDAGLADRVEVKAEAAPTTNFNLAVFNYAGRAHAPAPRVPVPPSASASGSSNTTQEGSPFVDLTTDQLTTMRQALGLAEDADGATLVAALSEALNERAEPVSPITNALPDGHVSIPAVMLEDLQANARLGAQAAEQLRAQDRDSFLDSMRAKFPPANRAAWASQFDSNPTGTREFLASMPDIINLSPLGHDGQPQMTSDDELLSLVGWTTARKEN